MKELYCTKCGKKYWGTRKGKCPTCWYKDNKKLQSPPKPKKKSNVWKTIKKIHSHMNDIKPLEPRKRKKAKAKS